MSSLRHAYLIMAYGEYEQLNLLIRTLDYPDNDIYVHIDKKSPKPDMDTITKDVKYSNVQVYQEYKVYWGDVSQTQCEVFLIEKALEKSYDYYHLLSGADLPLMCQRDIQKYFQENNGKEFVRYWGPEYQSNCINWLRLYHPLQKRLRISKYSFVNHFYQNAENIIEKLQMLFRVNRLRNNNLTLQKGATWFSITNALAQEVADRKQWINEFFKSTRSSDEVFLQTILVNSKLNKNRFEKTYEIDGLTGLRYIDWKRGKPYTFRNCDYEELMGCGFMFARKFSMRIDRDIVLEICRGIIKENENSLKNIE